ncbi:uncharacterized protein LOC112906705 [Agrilus planipennis]|uniref:Uncharacterized protein LOC112906705 n=1 Tax=Agrilus planipennis TaxID=224129 RepID=A0A7F5RMA4_AGRPL|nr:uncharacterized protein LOC112906705 [Agrilus planipennis]
MNMKTVDQKGLKYGKAVPLVNYTLGIGKGPFVETVVAKKQKIRIGNLDSPQSPLVLERCNFRDVLSLACWLISTISVFLRWQRLVIKLEHRTVYNNPGDYPTNERD